MPFSYRNLRTERSTRVVARASRPCVLWPSRPWSEIIWQDPIPNRKRSVGLAASLDRITPSFLRQGLPAYGRLARTSNRTVRSAVRHPVTRHHPLTSITPHAHQPPPACPDS